MSRGRLVQLALVGAAAGLFSGLFGVGGGVVIVPLLVLWLLFDERTATGTSLLAIAIVAAVGAAVQEVAYGNVLFWDGVLVGLPAVGGVLFGVWLQHHIPAAVVRILFAILLVGTAILLVAGTGWESAAGSGAGLGYYVAAATIGLAAGVLSGLLGVGGGAFFVPALILVLGHDQLDAEATSLLAIIPVSLVGAWRQHRYGNLDHRAGLVIGATAIPFAVIGVVVVNSVPARAVEIGFSLLLLYVAWQMGRGALTELRKGREPDDGAAGTR